MSIFHYSHLINIKVYLYYLRYSLTISTQFEVFAKNDKIVPLLHSFNSSSISFQSSYFGLYSLPEFLMCCLIHLFMLFNFFS